MTPSCGRWRPRSHEDPAGPLVDPVQGGGRPGRRPHRLDGRDRHRRLPLHPFRPRRPGGTDGAEPRERAPGGLQRAGADAGGQHPQPGRDPDQPGACSTRGDGPTSSPSSAGPRATWSSASCGCSTAPGATSRRRSGVGATLAAPSAPPDEGVSLEPASRLLRTTQGRFVQAVPVALGNGPNRLILIAGYDFSDPFAYRLRKQIGSLDQIVLVAGGQIAGSTLPEQPSTPPAQDAASGDVPRRAEGGRRRRHPQHGGVHLGQPVARRPGRRRARRRPHRPHRAAAPLAGPDPHGGGPPLGHGGPRAVLAAVPGPDPPAGRAGPHRRAGGGRRRRRVVPHRRRRRDRHAGRVARAHAGGAAGPARHHRGPGRAAAGELAAHRRRPGRGAPPAGPRPPRRAPAAARRPAHAGGDARGRWRRGARPPRRAARLGDRAAAGGHPRPVPVDPGRPGAAARPCTATSAASPCPCASPASRRTSPAWPPSWRAPPTSCWPRPSPTR